jgi:hypothetical protein
VKRERLQAIILEASEQVLPESDFSSDTLLVRINLIIEMILEDRP